MKKKSKAQNQKHRGRMSEAAEDKAILEQAQRDEEGNIEVIFFKKINEYKTNNFLSSLLTTSNC